jgi:hypothetical protein
LFTSAEALEKRIIILSFNDYSFLQGATGFLCIFSDFPCLLS